MDCIYMNNNAIIEAHKHSINNKAALSNDEKCGCFHCLRIFAPSDITDWIADKSGTAVCPHCGIDAVIGESSGCEVTAEFLTQMHKHWFC